MRASASDRPGAPSFAALWPWAFIAVVVVPLAALAVAAGPYPHPPLFRDVDWYSTALPALTSDLPLYDPEKLRPHLLQPPEFWDQAPSTALFVPVLLLPAGEWVWGIALLTCVVVALSLVWPRMRAEWSVLLGCALVAWWPVTGALLRGNLNALVMLCLAVALRFPRVAGIAIGAAAAAKFVPVLMIFWLAGRRDWRGVAAAVAIPMVATIIVLLWKGPESLSDFMTLRLNQTTPPATYRWGFSMVLGLPALIGYAVALVLASLAAWRASFSLAVLAMLVSIPAMHVHYWAWLLVPFLGIWMPALINRGNYRASVTARYRDTAPADSPWL